MISCTDFIPAYSELFCWLEENHGREEIDRYWKTVFKPGSGSPLINFVTAEGIRGCFTYWSGTLNEEAADFSMYLNEKRGFFKLVMHRCPSKGRLLELQEQIGLTPYRDYCLHCDCYRAACEKVGLRYIYDFQNMDKAGCSILIYDPKVFDGRVIMDEDTLVMERNASDNVYFHPSFHASLNRSLNYVGSHYGEVGVRGVLDRYAEHVILPLMGQVTLETIEQKIREDFRREQASQLLTLERNGNVLTAKVSRCPGVTYLLEKEIEVSPWFRCSTDYLMENLAARAGCNFEIISYEESTGAATYRFTKMEKI